MNKIPSMMGGEKVLVGNFAHTLRRELWMEHLNFSVEQVIDPLNEKLIEEMNIMAQVSVFSPFIS